MIFKDGSFKLKTSVQTYELSVDDLKQLIGQQLKVPVARITLNAKQRDVSDDNFSRYVFDGLTITVENT